MATKLEESEGYLNQAELDFFIKGNISLEKNDKANPLRWLPDKVI